MREVYLCLDCGLTNTKAVLFDEAGNHVGPERFTTPLDGYYIDTAALYHGITAIVRRLAEKSAAEGWTIKSVIVSGHGNGCYFLGQDGMLPKGISSMITDTLVIDTADVWELTGQSSWSGQPLAILGWLKKTDREYLDRVKYVLSCKDGVRYFITGVVATDYSDASAAGLLNRRTGEYSKELLALYGLEDYADRLPPILRGTDIAGSVSTEFSAISGLKEGTPVLAGLFDVSACILGSGVIVPGSYSMIAGTWGICAALTREPVYDRSITQTCFFLSKEESMCIDSAPTSLANISWFQRQEGAIGIDERNRMVEAAKRDATLLFLPYCCQPMDLGKVCAEYVGMRPEHVRGDRLRAVYEGIVFEHARRLAKLQNMGIRNDKIILSGGGAGSSVFAQMLADVTELPVETRQEPEAGALGGAICSAAVLGVQQGIQEAVERMVKKDNRYEPQPCAYYREKYALFLQEVNKRKRGSE